MKSFPNASCSHWPVRRGETRLPTSLHEHGPGHLHLRLQRGIHAQRGREELHSSVSALLLPSHKSRSFVCMWDFCMCVCAVSRTTESCLHVCVVQPSTCVLRGSMTASRSASARLECSPVTAAKASNSTTTRRPAQVSGPDLSRQSELGGQHEPHLPDSSSLWTAWCWRHQQDVFSQSGCGITWVSQASWSGRITARYCRCSWKLSLNQHRKSKNLLRTKTWSENQKWWSGVHFVVSMKTKSDPPGSFLRMLQHNDGAFLQTSPDFEHNFSHSLCLTVETWLLFVL